MEKFNISGVKLGYDTLFVEALAIVKMAAARANHELGQLPVESANAIDQACAEILNGKYHAYLTVDMFQGGAGTSSNVNANEVIANRALQVLNHKKGQYEYSHPNDRVNFHNPPTIPIQRRFTSP